MRIALALLVLAACDPIDKITVAFPVPPTSHAEVYWIHEYEGRTYADDVPAFRGDAPTGQLTFTRTECCGIAHEYRHHDLRYLACVQTGDTAELVCGRPDEPKLVRHPSPEPCATLGQRLSSRALDFAACTLSASAR